MLEVKIQQVAKKSWALHKTAIPSYSYEFAVQKTTAYEVSADCASM